MNSYPSELLMQLSPIMFIAGLNTLPSPPPSSDTGDAPLSPIGGTKRDTSTTLSVKRTTDPFLSLAQRLRDVLLAQRRSPIWQPGAGQPAGSVKVFHTVLVDKNVQFPPRKITPPSNPQATPHSPLSPLTPSSPLHPDGLIAPIWIRKHTALVPAVFILFVRMWEWDGSMTSSSETPRSPLERPSDREEKEIRDAREARQAAERQHDTELSREIAERKKSTSERGIKLTVVLMATRVMLDDPTLDTRLTYIRRTSGLDARAALFVLSPVGQSELVEFVKSLQQALYEPAIEYYAAHSKRVRRKRNRHAHAATSYSSHPSYSSFSTPAIATGPPPPLPTQPLRPEGWTVRYEYKMACFAEFRGEEEVALKHYQDAYSTLLSMFGSNPTGGSSSGGMLLIPRTKRWAEAKVLADCINVKIMKLFLCNAEHSLALSQLRTHLARFMELSERVWGIGRDMFEFWGWVARQYRVFAELLELGAHHNLAIPSYIPTPPPLAQPSSQIQPPSQNMAQGSTNVDVFGAVGGLANGLGLGLNPSTALHHPGFYYLVSAECTERRRERFLKAVSEEETTGIANQSPGFANEKKVDHLASILELYTKAYELFKKYSAVPPISPTASIHGLSQSQTLPTQSGNGRFTLLIAYRIAQTYYEAGKYDLAIRFFERISRNYRVEHFDSLLRPLLTTWCACARRLGDVETGVRVLVEGVVCGSSGSPQGTDNEEHDIVEDLKAVLESTVPSSSPLTVEIPAHLPILNSTVTFWTSKVFVNEPSAFQILLSAPNNISERLSKLPIKQIKILWGDDGEAGSVTVRRRERSGERSISKEVEYVDLGELVYATFGREEPTIEADLEIRPDGMIVLAGRMVSDVPGDFKITKAVLTLASGAWTVDIPFDLNIARGRGPPNYQWYVPGGNDEGKFVTIRRREASSVSVEHRPHQLQISFSHASPAYLDERHPITLAVTNLDERELDVIVDVLLQPGEDDSINTIELASHTSTGLIKGVSFGAIQPGISTVKTLHLHSTGLPEKRLIDFSIQSRLFAASSSRSIPTSPRSPRSPKSPGFYEPISPVVPLSTHETLQTLEVETIAPFSAVHDVTYRHKRADTKFCAGTGVASLETFDRDWWEDRVGGEASIVTEIECAIDGDGESGVVIEGIKLVRRRDGDFCKITSCSVDEDEFPMEFWAGDRYAAVCDLSLAPSEDFFADGEDDIPSPGGYEITWRRESGYSNSASILTTTTLPLPSLRPPASNLSLTALIEVPSAATLHSPILMTLVLRNNHPTRTACPFIVLEPQGHQQNHSATQSISQPERPSTPTPANIASTSSNANAPTAPDPFVVSGLRSGRALILVPGAETRIAWTLFPMTCGPHVPLPRVRVFDKRDSEAGRFGGSMDGSIMTPGGGSATSAIGGEEKGEVEVRVIDSRWDQMRGDGSDALDSAGESKGRFAIVVSPA